MYHIELFEIVKSMDLNIIICMHNFIKKDICCFIAFFWLDYYNFGIAENFANTIVIVFIFELSYFTYSFIYLDSFFTFLLLLQLRLIRQQFLLRWINIYGKQIFYLFLFWLNFLNIFCYIEIKKCRIIIIIWYIYTMQYIFYMLWLCLYMFIIFILYECTMIFDSVYIAYINRCFDIFYNMFWNVLCILIIINTNKKTIILTYIFLQSIFTLLKYIYSNIHIFW